MDSMITKNYWMKQLWHFSNHENISACTIFARVIKVSFISSIVISTNFLITLGDNELFLKRSIKAVTLNNLLYEENLLMY